MLLERLSDARRNGHEVLAVVAGSAINQDGASNGLTAPNGPSQQRVIRAALAAAGLRPDEVDAVEAHGTGTTLGDPIEAQAVIATYGQDRDRPLWLGSVKSNIGHPQQAAGAAGVIKMVLALRHGLLPRTLHADEPSPHIDWSAGDVRLLHQPVPWAPGGTPRRAGVSSFGMSGTNVHVILEEPPRGAGAEPAGAGDAAAPLVSPLVAGATAWVVSARTEAGVRAQAGRLAAHLAEGPADQDPADVAWSLATARSVFEHRAVLVGTVPGELAPGRPRAGRAGGGGAGAGVLVGPGGRGRSAADPGQVVFVFPGQGSQWAGMGRELAACCPVFAARLAACGRALAPHVDWDLADVLARDELPAQADVVQPVLWAVMVSLAAVWEAAGVTPDAVLGHSQGEIAAATVAGILTLDDAARVVAVRSRALSGLGAQGGMLSVVMPEDRVRGLMAPWGERLAVAAVNGPAATVVSGDLEALTGFETELSARHAMRWRVPETDFVAHSSGVAELAPILAAGLAGVRPSAGRARLYSAALGRWMDGAELDAGYWYENVRRTVRFADAIGVLAGQGYGAYVEVSPHPTLEAAVADTIEESAPDVRPVISGTLHQASSGAAQVLSVLARAFARGVAVDWAAVLGGGRRVGLPTYAFQHERYWPQVAPAIRPGGRGRRGHRRRDVVLGRGGRRRRARPGRTGGGGRAAAVRRGAAGAGGLAAPGTGPVRHQGWRYRITWAPVTEPGPAILSGRWLLVVPAGQAGAYPRVLESRGAQVTVLEAAPDELDRDVLAARLREVPGASAACGVVSLLALDEAPAAGFPAVPRGLAGTMALLQALGDAGVYAPLWVLTRGAVATGGGEALTSPVQAMTWGLGRVASVEYRDRWGALIDLPPVLDERAAGRLCAVLAGGAAARTRSRSAARASWPGGWPARRWPAIPRRGCRAGACW